MGTVSIYSNPPGGTKARAASYAMKGAQHRDRLAAEKAGLKWIPGMGPEEVALKAKVAAERRGLTLGAASDRCARARSIACAPKTEQS